MVDVIKGRYQIVREIARSNDIVYEARDGATNRRVALKELNIAPGMNGQARRERIERFNREARAAGKLSHPNIVSIYEVGEENGRHFIAMEYLDGQTLRDVMQVRGALPVREAIDIACQILDALGHAHSRKVIHRDIKPDNIFLLPGGQIKLADFGIARLSEEPALTSNGQVFGTPSYMSPEQIEGKHIDHRSDLFSLAVLLYEMLAGRKPFTGDSVISITYAVMNAEPSSLHGVPSGIEGAIRRALAKTPAGRYATAEQFKNDLRAAERVPDPFQPAKSPRGGRGNASANNNAPFPGSNLPPLSFPPTGSVGGLPNYSGGIGSGNGGYGSGSTGYGGSPGYGGSASLPPPMPSNPSPPPVGNLPWQFNNGLPGTGVASAPSLPKPPPAYTQAGAIPGAPGFPAAANPFPRRPSAPVFTVSPGARSFLLAVLAAAILGGGMAGGIIAVTRSYDSYKVNTGFQRVTALMNKAFDEYNKQDFASAAHDFEAALTAGPNAKQREIIATNLAFTYVQLARLAEAKGQRDEAHKDYQAALSYKPDYEAALAGLRQYESGAVGAAGVSGGAGATPPSSINARDIPTTPDPPSSAPSQQEFVGDRRAQARQLIGEGDQLANQNNLDGARSKWREAMATAPGTPERDLAQERIDRSSPPVDFGGDG